MQEWSTKNKFNSFNSWKGLAYMPQYEGIISGKFLPPVEASVDPANECNLNCFFCNGREPKSRLVRMTREHLLDLMMFLSHWGVRAVCFAGGGEPTLHDDLPEAFDLLNKLQLPAAIITNGVSMGEELKNSLAKNAQWIGVSVDAARSDTYEAMKGHDKYRQVLRNISSLLEKGAKEVTYKFLVHPCNQYEIFDAIVAAAQLGCHAIHIRPIAFKCFASAEKDYDIRSINEQIELGFKNYGDRLRIYAVRHKYDENMHVKFPFKKCLTTPIMPIFSANGDLEMCIDRKGDPKMYLCSHEDLNKVREFWGSDDHKNIIDNIDLKDCSKCTLNYANEFIEEVVIKDKMHWRFT